MFREWERARINFAVIWEGFCACTRTTTLSFGPVARSQASVLWSRRGSGSKRSWKRWPRRLVLWTPPGPSPDRQRSPMGSRAARGEAGRLTSTRRPQRSCRRSLRSLARRRLGDRRGRRAAFGRPFALSEGTMRHWHWRAISCPPALARCGPASVPSARGFFCAFRRLAVL
jgi:hypothetical protein